MRRRDFVALLTAAAATPRVVHAQQAPRSPRVGYLAANLKGNPSLREAFRQGLRDLGYVEGQNIVIEYRSADGEPGRLPELAAELVRLKVDVMVGDSTPPALAAKKATASIPIVFCAVADAAESGLVASLAHPGSNVSGLSFLGPETVGKCVQLLKETIPRLSGIGVLSHPGNPSEATRTTLLREAESAARTLSLRLHSVEVRTPDDFEKAFSEMTRARAGGVVVLTSVMFLNERRRLVEVASKSRLPAVYPWREPVDAGGLMSYGANLPDLYRRAAGYVDRILKGTKPAAMPVEQPTKFELVVNLRTAKALGLTVPSSVLGRADQVID